jgi:hypothetical protein
MQTSNPAQAKLFGIPLLINLYIATDAYYHHNVLSL